jgi:hypothetical protein
MLKNRGEKGFAMGLFLITFLVLGSISATMTYVTSRDYISSNNNSTKNDARIIAVATSDYITAQTRIDNNYIYNILSNSRGISDNKCLSTANEFKVLNCNADFINYSEMNLDGTSSIFPRVKCLDMTRGVSLYSTCVSAYVLPITSNGDIKTDIGDRVVAAKVFIKVRSGCRGLIQRCRYTTFQETFRAKNFFDYMYYTKYTTLDPNLYGTSTVPAPVGIAASACAKFAADRRSSSCLDVAFTKNDNFTNNPIFYTEDSYFSICEMPSGSPLNPSNIYSERKDPTNNSLSLKADPNCPNSPAVSSYTNAGKTNTIGNLPELLPSIGVNSLLANSIGNKLPGSGVCTYKRSSNSDQSLNYSGGTLYMSDFYVAGTKPATPVTLAPDCKDLIIYSDIPGTSKLHIVMDNIIDKRISIISSGSIEINGNTCYQQSSSISSCPIVPVVSSSNENVLSLVADKDITIFSPENCNLISCDDKTISAYMYSASRAIYVYNWDGSIVLDPYKDMVGKPSLYFYGSIVSKFQPVFGSYDANTGLLYSGYKKTLTFDNRVKSGKIFIPYIIDPKIPQWEKFELVEVASKTP